RGPLDRRLNRRNLAEEAHGIRDAELTDERLQRGFEWPAAGDLQLEIRQLLPRFRERAQQDEVALDGNQTADTEEARHGVRVRLRLTVGIDPVVHDLEALVVEPFDVLEVAGESA